MDKTAIVLIPLVLLVVVAASGWADTIPDEVFGESYNAHRAWLAIQVGIHNEERINELVPSVEEIKASTWQPFKMYIIQANELGKCESGQDLIEKMEFEGYRAPLLLGNEVGGYTTVKNILDNDTGLNQWKFTGFTSTSFGEAESYYYSLLEKYPTDKGYVLYMLGIQYLSRPYVLIVDPEKNYWLHPITKNSLIHLKLIANKDYDYESIRLEQILPLFKTGL